MSQSVIGALRVNLGLDAAQFQRGARRAQTTTQRLQRDFQRLGLAAAAAGAALVAMARQSMNTIDQQAKLARAVGGTTIGLQALARAGDRAGVQQSELSSATTRLNQQLGQAMIQGRGTEGVFRRLGVSAQALAGMDVDERFMAIADAMRDAGMNTQEMAATLRELGIRQASVITLIQGGSEEIRRSRQAVIDFGVAVSEVDAAQIERTNDALSEVGRVFEGLRNQIAVALAPGLEMLANAFTESARAGGLVFNIIRGFVEQVPRLTSYITAAVGGFALYRGALLAVAAAKWALVGATGALRVALIRLGFGALIVGAGELVHQFSRLSAAAGGFGEAMSALGDLARGVFQGIVTTAQAIPSGLSLVWNGIKLGFNAMIFELSLMWRRFLSSLADSIPSDGVFGAAFSGLRESIEGAIRSGDEFRRGINASSVAIIRAGNESGAAWRDARDNAFEPAREALARLRDIMSQTGAETDTTRDAVQRINEELDATEGSGGRAARGVRETADAVEDLADRSREVESAFESAFVGIVSGTRSARDAIRALLQDLARMLAQRAFQMLFGAGGPLGNIFGGFRAMGGPVSAGKAYVVGEQGPEMFVPSGAGQIVPNHALGGGGVVRLVVEEGPMFAARVRAESTDVAVEVVQGGIAEFNRQLPGRVQQISNDPRRMR